MRSTTRWLFAILLIFTSLTTAIHAQELTSNGEPIYTFGIVPQFEQRKLFRIWQPIIDEIERQTGLHLKIKGSPKIPTFEKNFLGGKFDFAFMNPYHIILANQSQGYIPLVRDGGRSLQGILVVKKDSDIKEVSQLNSRQVAFPAPNALGASLIMRADFQRSFGLNITSSFVQTHSSVYLSVVKGLADAGGGVLSTLNLQKPAIKDQLRVIYKTRKIPPHPIAAHPRVPKQHRDMVANAILNYANSLEGKNMLAKIPIKQAIATHIEDYQVISEWQLEQFYVANKAE